MSADEFLERYRGIDHPIDQRRPRSRASRASAVEMGVRRSALRSNLENALRPAGSSRGLCSRCASARAARRTNALRVSPALRAAASMIRRSVSGSETRTLRIPIVYLTDIRRGWFFPNAEPGEEGIDRADMETATTTVVAKICRGGVIFALGHDQRQRSESIKNLRSRFRAAESLQDLLKNQACGEDRSFVPKSVGQEVHAGMPLATRRGAWQATRHWCQRGVSIT